MLKRNGPLDVAAGGPRCFPERPGRRQNAARCSVPSSIEKHLPRRLTQKPQVRQGIAPTPGGRVVSSSRKSDTVDGAYVGLSCFLVPFSLRSTVSSLVQAVLRCG